VKDIGDVVLQQVNTEKFSLDLNAILN